MSDDGLTPERIAAITAYVDVEAPSVVPSAHLIFGTRQATPATLVAERYHQGLAPLIILTGGGQVGDGTPAAQQMRRSLLNRDVPESAIRYEDLSGNTWGNVESALPHLREATGRGLPITAVCRWYHRRAVHVLRTLLPEVGSFHASTWEPVYAATMVTRANWPWNPEGRRQVVRESQEIPRLVADGSVKETHRVGGAWH